MKLTTSQARLLCALDAESGRAISTAYLYQRLTGMPIKNVRGAERAEIQRDIEALNHARLVTHVKSGEHEFVGITLRGRIEFRWGRRTWECRFSTLFGFGLHRVPGDIKLTSGLVWQPNR